jgi:hypothetical protein
MAAKKKTSKKTARKSGGSNKTQFVLGLPRDVAARDVVKQAKEKGITISEAYVYKIRSSSKGPAAPKAPKAEPKVAGPGKRSAGMSKVDFVRSLPQDTSYADAAEKAKAVGIDLSKAYFYVLKSEAKKKGVKAGTPVVKGKPGRKPKNSGGAGLRLSSGDPNEQAVLDAVRILGTDRARALIAVVEKFERG